MKTIGKVLTIAATLLAISSASAINFDLLTVNATQNSGNIVADFADISGSGNITGDAAGLGYIATLGGTEEAGWWVKIDFNGNAQPELTEASLKAGNGYLLWDSTDLAPFNAGVFTSITLWNSGPNGLKNPPGNAYLGTSHAGLEGTPGTSVPDGGATAALLGLGVIGLAALRRKS